MKSKVLVIVPTFVGSSSLGRKTYNKINSSDTVKTSVAYASANTNPAKNQSKKCLRNTFFYITVQYLFLFSTLVMFSFVVWLALCCDICRFLHFFYIVSNPTEVELAKNAPAQPLSQRGFSTVCGITQRWRDRFHNNQPDGRFRSPV